MTRPILFALFLIVLIIGSCQIENLHPKRRKNISKSAADQANLTGTWQWSAQYSGGNPPAYILNPSNTGITETLNLYGNNNWSQVQNGKTVNSGSYSLVNVLVPGYNISGDTVIFINFINSNVTDTARTDNFNFNTGFESSFAVSKDSLVFYGVYSTGNFTNLASARVYVK